jgi:hypothetical protein
VVLGRSGQPDAVVARVRFFLAKHEHDLVFDIDRGAAEHRARRERKRVEVLEHEFERDYFSAFTHT